MSDDVIEYKDGSIQEPLPFRFSVPWLDSPEPVTDPEGSVCPTCNLRQSCTGECDCNV